MTWVTQGADHHHRRGAGPRGTPLHHFPTKVDLLVGAVHYVSGRRVEALSAELGGTRPAPTPSCAPRGSPGDPRVPTVVEFSYEVLTGLAMTGIVSGDLGRRELLIRRWKRAAATLLGHRDPSTLVERARSKES